MAKVLLLLVEDEPDLRVVTTTRLKSAGYEIVAVYSAEDALSSLKTSIPDLILLDLILPKMQGEALCKKLKSDPKYAHIPIIIFTAKAINIPKDLEAIGADDYIMKPFEPEDMLKKIKKQLAQARRST